MLTDTRLRALRPKATRGALLERKSFPPITMPFELSAIGRNLNTITHRLLRSGQFEAGLLDLQTLAKSVERLRREMTATTTRASHRVHRADGQGRRRFAAGFCGIRLSDTRASQAVSTAGRQAECDADGAALAVRCSQIRPTVPRPDSGNGDEWMRLRLIMPKKLSGTALSAQWPTSLIQLRLRWAEVKCIFNPWGTAPRSECNTSNSRSDRCQQVLSTPLISK